MLCVFSYIAAGQEQKKNFNPQKALSQAQQQPKSPLPVQSQQQRPTSSQQQNRQSVAAANTTTTKPSQIKPQTINIQPQQPTVTLAMVQPQSKTGQNSTPSPPASNVQSASFQKAPSLPSRPSISEQIKPNLPQLPPRVQSQGSVIGRGPPPEIPPRNNVPAPIRSSSIHVTGSPLNRPALTRQPSANSIPPQFTPQPPPKFVIPQRQNSRSGSISGPSGSNTGSPQLQRHH